jgi:DNA ligase-1
MLLKACEVLELLSKTPGRLDKEKILRDNKDNEELKFLFETSFNPYLIYGVKDFEVLSSIQNIPTLDFLRRLRKTLVEGEVTGDSAKGALELTLSSSNELSMKWLEATFKKNIKCGVDVKTINKVWPGLVPTFEVGLCEVFKGDKLPEGSWAIEPKLNGLRCLTIIDKEGNISFKSRTGKELFNLGHIEKELKELGLKELVIDGEIFAGNWNDTVAITHSEKNLEGKNKENAKYYVFDAMGLEAWEKRIPSPYYMRKILLKGLFFNCKNIIYVAGKDIGSLEEVNEIYRHWLEQGYEGVVLKETLASYPFKRSKNWLKYKPFYSVDLPIVGYEEGIGRNKGRLGKFLCDFKGVIIGVGGGYSDKQREAFWINREEMIGNIVEVKYWEITQDGSLRFPVFLRLRLDK